MPDDQRLPAPAERPATTSMMTPEGGAYLRLADSLATWGPAEPVPDGVTALLPEAIAAAERDSRGASLRDFAVAMDDILGWVERFGLAAVPANVDARRCWMRDVVADYRDGLADIPADLLTLAVKRIKGAHRWRSMPAPADLRAAVDGELSRRRAALRRLRLARDVAARTAPPSRTVSDAERERVKAMMDDFRRRGGLRVVDGGQKVDES